MTTQVNMVQLVDGQAANEIERPRSAWQLIGATFGLYRRFPWLFLILAAVVVVPYELLDLLARQGLAHGTVRTILELLLPLADIALVLPLVSALHVHAVDDVREGREPRLGPVFRHGAKALPVVSPAMAISYVCIVFGFVALIVPGVILLVQWAVVAPTATLSATGWRDALYQSKTLSNGHGRHVLGLLALVILITWAPGLVFGIVFGSHLALGLFLMRTAIDVATTSFGALAIGLLYFDLRARPRQEQPAPRPIELPGDPLASTGYDDASRPSGWYVDPGNPRRMRYWADGWSESTTRTPKKTLAEWEQLNDR